MVRPVRRTDLPPERMTPVKIRGKRGQKARLRALREQRAQRAGSHESDTVSTTPLFPTLSKLESLPIELLEAIFLYSQEVNLPRASLALGKALSSAHVKDNLLRSLLTGEYDLEAEKASGEAVRIGKLQFNLLKCRWLDLAAIKRGYAATVTSILERSLPSPFPGFNKRNISLPLIPTSSSQSYHPSSSLSLRTAQPQTGSSLFIPTVSQLVQHVFAQHQDYQGDHWSIGDSGQTDLIISHSGVFCWRPTINGFFAVRPGCEIPTKLLHGPWTAERITFLGYIMDAKAALDPDNSNNEEVADQSLREAIREGNTSAVKALRRGWLSHDGLCRIPITLDHVRLAIFEGGCKPEVLDLLASPKAREVRELYKEKVLDWAQDDIMDWANARAASGDGRGARLLEMMDSLAKEGRIEGRVL